MNQAFPSERRLHRPAEFERVFQGTCRAGDRALLLLASPNGLPYPRLGLAISRRHLPKAVERNRIKRLIRESFRQHQDLLAGLDVVAIARKGIRALDNAQILQALSRHWLALSRACRPSS